MLTVYILKHPNFLEPKYVGISSQVEVRYKQHMHPCHLEDNTYKNNWIKSLLTEDIKPEWIQFRIIS